MKAKWYVVAYTYHDIAPPEMANKVWTVSRDPSETGWETDCGQPGYGLTYAEANELASSANFLNEALGLEQ